MRSIGRESLDVRVFSSLLWPVFHRLVICCFSAEFFSLIVLCEFAVFLLFA